METIKDLWASLVASVSERSTNPLTSAFIVSWAIWNYKFFVVLFNDEKSSEKFAAIATLYPRTDTQCFQQDALCMLPDAFWSSAFMYPLLTTLFYVFAYPYLTKQVVTFYRARQIEISNELRTVERQRLRTVEEFTQLVRRSEKRLKESQDETSAAQQELTDVRHALQAAELELKDGPKRSLFESTTADEGEIVNPAPSSIPKLVDSDLLDFVVRIGPKHTVGSITVRQAKILSFLTDMAAVPAADIRDYLEMRNAEFDNALAALEKFEAVEWSGSEVKITDMGWAILYSLLDQGKWAIQPHRVNRG